MVISSTSSSIRAYHWLLAIGFALLAHSVLLIKYPGETVTLQESDLQQAVVISLKRMKALPPAPTSTQTVTTPEVSPQKIEPIHPQTKPIKKTVKKPTLTERKLNLVAQPPIVDASPKTVIQESLVKNPYAQQGARDEVSDTFPESISGVESNDIKLKYQTKLAAWLAKHKRYPKLAQRRKQEGVVKVKFWIDAQGRLLSHQLLNHSSYDSLNKEVERMLKRASPMPPIPPGLRKEGEQYTYTIPVRFELKVVN